MNILAFDPGLTTGIAFGIAASGGFDKFRTWMPEGFSDVCDYVRWLLDPYGQTAPAYPDLVVMEKFTITKKTAEKSTAGSKTAIELCGVIRFFAHNHGVKLIEQKPADAMNFVTDRKLKTLGMYTPGPDHARDATRHLVLAAVNLKQLDLRQFLTT